MSGSEERVIVPDLRELAADGPVHFVGIGGAGVSAIAELVLRAGGRVTGCDLRPGQVGAALENLGAVVWEGHDPAHIEDAVAVVTTAAVPHDHPELEAARAREIPVLKRAEALGALVNNGRVIAIAGTHGKTTTTALTTAVLAEASLDPTGFIGGQVPGWVGGLRLGSDELYVVEADEYDRSFLTLRPEIAVLTAIDADHLEIYGSIEEVESAFAEFIAPIPVDGLILACSDDPGVRRLLEARGGGEGPRVVTYGIEGDAELRARSLVTTEKGTSFTIERGGNEIAEVMIGLPGLHNVRNALAAIGVAQHLGVGPDALVAGLEGFTGVARRFEILGEAQGILVIDDYAHHPTEVEATLAAARAAFPDRRLIAVFQPHLYSRTRDFATELGTALQGADEVWVTDIFAAREAPIEGVSARLVTEAVGGEESGERSRPVVEYHPEQGTLIEALLPRLGGGDLVVTMGAGDIGQVARRLLIELGGAF